MSTVNYSCTALIDLRPKRQRVPASLHSNLKHLDLLKRSRGCRGGTSHRQKLPRRKTDRIQLGEAVSYSATTVRQRLPTESMGQSSPSTITTKNISMTILSPAATVARKSQPKDLCVEHLSKQDPSVTKPWKLIII